MPTEPNNPYVTCPVCDWTDLRVAHVENAWRPFTGWEARGFVVCLNCRATWHQIHPALRGMDRISWDIAELA